MFRKQHGTFREQNEMLVGWEELLKKMKAVKEDITMQQFLEAHYSGFENSVFRKHITAYTEGFDIADPKRVSMKSLYKEWSVGDEENYRIPGGYILLMQYLHLGAEEHGTVILTGKKIKQVEFKENNVTLYAQGREKFVSNKLLVTVPVSILQQSTGTASIHFKPHINEYLEAARNIGFGSVIKVVLLFKKAFWTDDAGFFFSDDSYFPTWWTQLPSRVPILTGWCGGPKAAAFSRETKDAILEQALRSLADIFEKPMEELNWELLEAQVFNWEQDEFAFGGYSYETPRSISAKKMLSKPILNTIFFAGEAVLSSKYPGTVEASLESGKRVAKAIKQNP